MGVSAGRRVGVAFQRARSLTSRTNGRAAGLGCVFVAFALLGTAVGAAAPAAASPRGSLLTGVPVAYRGLDLARAMVVRLDGKILVVGDTSKQKGNSNFALAQLNPDGSLDTSFGSGGRAQVDFAGLNDFADAVALQADGKILVAGSTSHNGDYFAVARLSPRGSLDRSFGTGGKTIIDFGGDETATAIAVRPDGKIVVAGYTLKSDDTRDFAVAQLNPNGVLDGSFGTGGKATVDLGGDEAAYAVALQPDGKIVLAGYRSNGTNGEDLAVTRLTPDGVVDDSFGLIDGTANVNLFGDEQAYGVAVQPDGKIVAAGFTSNGASGSDFLVTRLNPDGLADDSFGTGSVATVDLGGDDVAYAMALQPDGDIVVGGATFPGTGRSEMAVARLLPDGQADDSFGTKGLATVDFGRDAGAFSVGLQPDGDIAVAGGASNGSATEMLVASVPGFPHSSQIRSAAVSGHGNLRGLHIDVRATERAGGRLRLLASGVSHLQRTFSVKPGKNLLQVPIPRTLMSTDYQLEITLTNAQGQMSVYRTAVLVPG